MQTKCQEISPTSMLCPPKVRQTFGGHSKQAQGLIDWDKPLVFNYSDWKRDKLFKKLLGDGERTAYCLRHTFSTVCQEHLKRPDIVDIWMGDSPQRLVGKVYTHFPDEFMDEQMQKVHFPLP